MLDSIFEKIFNSDSEKLKRSELIRILGKALEDSADALCGSGLCSGWHNDEEKLKNSSRERLKEETKEEEHERLIEEIRKEKRERLKEEFFDNILIANEVSCMIMTPIYSGKHKLEKKEVAKLTLINKKISHTFSNFMSPYFFLIDSEEDVFGRGERNYEIQGLLLSIVKFMNRSKIVEKLMDYEER